MKHKSDTELVDLVVKKDDRGAFEELIKRYQRGVFALLHRVIGKAAEVEDVAQEVFLAIYRSLSHFGKRAKFSTWVYRITYNKACTALRQRSAKKEKMLVEIPEDESGKQMEFEDKQYEDPEKKLTKQHIWQKMDTLPILSKTVLELYYRQDRSYQEIADILKLPLGTIKTYLHRAKSQLRTAILEESQG